MKSGVCATYDKLVPRNAVTFIRRPAMQLNVDASEQDEVRQWPGCLGRKQLVELLQVVVSEESHGKKELSRAIVSKSCR